MRKIIGIFFMVFLAVHLGQAQSSKVSPQLKEKVAKVASELETFVPYQLDPLSLNATIVWAADRTQFAVVLKALVLDNWHIYAYVPPTQPFIATELKLDLPPGISTIGDWEKPAFNPYQDGIYVYKGELVFVQYCLAEDIGQENQVRAGLYYQSCDLHKCFLPREKIKDLKLDF